MMLKKANVEEGIVLIAKFRIDTDAKYYAEQSQLKLTGIICE